MITSFNEILSSALTPTMLISGVGLMMLCMTNRYNSTTDRIRKLIKRREASGLKNEPCIDTEIRYVFRRAALLRHAMLCISSSAVCTGFLVATSHFINTDLTSLAVLWLFLSIGLILLSSLFFLFEVLTSLKALGIAVSNLPGKRKKHYARFY